MTTTAIRILTAMLVATTAVRAQKPTFTNERPKLPRDQPYQQQLCAWMGTLKLADVRLDRGEVRWDGTVRDAEHASQVWGYFGYGGPKPGTVMQCPAEWFVLDDGAGHGIEGSGRVRQPRFANSAAVYRILDLPQADGTQGNPYFGNDALARRVLVATAVDLMMTDDSHDKIGSIARSDFLGGSMNAWVETYEICHDVLDAEVRAAFQAGFERAIDKFLAWGPRDVNTNMDMRAIAAAARFYAVSADQRVRGKCLRVARRFLFGFEDGSLEKLDSIKGTYFPAGYIGENNGPETTYNGVSYYHLLEARCAVVDDPAWAFLDPVLRAMLNFKLHQYYPNHGLYDGPAGYACRTGNSYVYDQRGRAWRDVAAADLYPQEALALTYSHQRKEPKLPDLESLVGRLKSQVRRLNRYGTAAVTEEPPMIWEADHKHHWPPDGTYFSRPGWYQRLQAAFREKSDALHVPYDKPGLSFSRFFGAPGQEEFWAYRRAEDGRDFGFFVEHVPRTWPYGSWAGGSLQTFWSRKTGILLLAIHDKAGDEFEKRENSRVYRTIGQWASDHVWGRAGNRSFTTATAFNHAATKVRCETGEAPWVETVTGFCSDQGELHATEAKVRSRFEPTPGGLKVSKTIEGEIGAGELWATIPVFLRNARRQKDFADTTIEGWLGGGWRLLGENLESVPRIRLGRDTGHGIAHAVITFAQPRRVRLAEPWQAAYQSRNRVQNIQIDLLESKNVVWTIAAGD